MRLLAFLLAFASFASAQEKVLRIPVRADGPKTLDPVRGSTQYEAEVCDQVYETLLQYNYLADPLRLEPLLVEEMPQVTDSRIYRFKLKKGVRFRDDPCFPDGKGRELVARDVFYSWKRMADEDNRSSSWWLFEGTIKGFDEYRKAQNAAKKFDYDAPVEGMRILSDHEFEVELNVPVPRFLSVIAMFQTGIVPREAAETYGDAFGNHPVGTGPFLLRNEEDWQRTKSITLYRNPQYRDERFPESGGETRHEAAGRRLPFADRIEITFFQEDQPMWLEWKAGHLDFVTVPAENFTEAYTKRKQTLKKEWEEQGVASRPVKLLDFIFHGFNMEDPVVGGYTEEKKALRRAIHLAVDLQEFNDTFYNGINTIYDGPIPPGLEGFPPEGRTSASNRGPDLERARALLAKAGYPDGNGLPELDYWTSSGGNQAEQVELLRRQLSRIGVRLKPRLVDFSQLDQKVKEKGAQMFSYAWGSDYPDAENNLALFFGPNEAPGSNGFNYKNPAYDELYRTILSMTPSPDRTDLYEKMRDIVIEDCPYIGSMARIRFYLVRPRLKHCRPTETFWNWFKYMDVEPGGK